MNDAKPSPEAQSAVRESEVQLQQSRKLVSQMDISFSEVRGILEANHFADKIKLRLQGA